MHQFAMRWSVQPHRSASLNVLWMMSDAEQTAAPWAAGCISWGACISHGKTCLLMWGNGIMTEPAWACAEIWCRASALQLLAPSSGGNRYALANAGWLACKIHLLLLLGRSGAGPCPAAHCKSIVDSPMSLCCQQCTNGRQCICIIVWKQ